MLDFRQILVLSLDEVLGNVLSEKIRVAFYDQMASRYHITKDEIPSHLNDFVYALEDIFGRNSKIIERNTAKVLYCKLGLRFTVKLDYGLLEYVEEAMRYPSAYRAAAAIAMEMPEG